MVLFRRKERRERREFGDDLAPPKVLAVQGTENLLGDPPLRLVLVEDDGAVLGTDIRALSVLRRRVVGRHEDREEVTVGEDLGVEGDLDDLGVSCAAPADLLVRRVGHRAARVAGHHAEDAPQLGEDGLRAPEAPAAYRGDRGRGGSARARLGGHRLGRLRGGG